MMGEGKMVKLELFVSYDNSYEALGNGIITNFRVSILMFDNIYIYIYVNNE